MARDLNKVMLIGRLTQDPEVRTTPNGQTVATFSVATSRQWKDAQGTLQSQSEFHNVVAWRKLAEVSQQYLTKGKQVYIEGYLQTRSWVGQQDSIKRYRTEVIADNIIFLGSPSNNSSTTGTPVAAKREFNDYSSTTPPAPNEMSSTPAQPVAPVDAPQEEEIRIEDIPF